MSYPITEQQVAQWKAERERSIQQQADKELMVQSCITVILGDPKQVHPSTTDALWCLSNLVHPQVFIWFLKGVEKWRRTLN